MDPATDERWHGMRMRRPQPVVESAPTPPFPDPTPPPPDPQPPTPAPPGGPGVPDPRPPVPEPPPAI